MDVEPGTSAAVTHEVTPSDTADALGSGSLPVLGSPRLLAWAEAATVLALDGLLDHGETSVGTSIRLEHTAPSAVGDVVTVTAEVTVVEGSRVTFTVAATGRDDEVVGRATVERAVVDAARFTARVARD